MSDDQGWRENIITDPDGIAAMLSDTKRIAVLGIKTELQGGQPAIEIPRYMANEGFEVVPVPVYYPDATVILGRPVYRSIAEIPGPIDMVNVFRRSSDVLPHVDDIIAKNPRFVWMQSGIASPEAAERLARVGIKVVQDRCLMVEHARRTRGR